MDGQSDDKAMSPGTAFGRYRIVRKLGEGGMGVVYEAEHLGLNRRVALKTVHARLADNAEVVGRFLREGVAAARIRHPHVVDMIDVGTEGGVPYLVMEMLEGYDLSERIRKGAMQPDEIAAVMLPVLAAVATAHKAGIVHRDLKPDNIFLATAEGGRVTPKVLDFGIAKIFGDETNLSLTATSTVLGTPYYMSPEQARGAKHTDARSDQYALGVILYECAAGRRPFDADSLLALVHQVSFGELHAPSTHHPELPPAFDAVVLRAMTRDPAGRFPSVTALGAALMPFADERVRHIWSATFPDDALFDASDDTKVAARDSRAPIPGSTPPPKPDTHGPWSTQSRRLPATAAGAPPSRRPLLIGGVLAGLLIGAGVFQYAMRPPPAAALNTVRVVTVRAPAPAVSPTPIAAPANPAAPAAPATPVAAAPTEPRPAVAAEPEARASRRGHRRAGPRGERGSRSRRPLVPME